MTPRRIYCTISEGAHTLTVYRASPPEATLTNWRAHCAVRIPRSIIGTLPGFYSGMLTSNFEKIARAFLKGMR